MLAASNAFIILHDHDFITTKSQEAVLLIKPMLVSMISQNDMSETYEHRRHLGLPMDQKGS